MSHRARERLYLPVVSTCAARRKGEILLSCLLLNSVYLESPNSHTMVSGATHSPTSPSLSTGAELSNRAKRGCREVKRCAGMVLALIQCCLGVPWWGDEVSWWRERERPPEADSASRLSQGQSRYRAAIHGLKRPVGPATHESRQNT